MMKHRNILANPKYGAVSFVSYFYFLLYELFSPYIEIFGVMTMILAYFVDLINVPFMLLFFAIYVVYTAILSLTAFLARIHTIDMKLYFADLIKAGRPVCRRSQLPAFYHGLGADNGAHRLQEEEKNLGTYRATDNRVQIILDEFRRVPGKRVVYG